MVRVELAQGEGAVQHFMLEDGRNRVSNLLDMAGASLEGRKIRVNGETADMDTALRDGDLVLLQQKVSGGTS